MTSTEKLMVIVHFSFFGIR